MFHRFCGFFKRHSENNGVWLIVFFFENLDIWKAIRQCTLVPWHFWTSGNLTLFSVRWKHDIVGREVVQRSLLVTWHFWIIRGSFGEPHEWPHGLQWSALIARREKFTRADLPRKNLTRTMCTRPSRRKAGLGLVWTNTNWLGFGKCPCPKVLVNWDLKMCVLLVGRFEQTNIR